MEPEERPTAAELLGKAQGLECRKCGSKKLWVVWTRRATGGRIMRKRKCKDCGHPKVTFEHEAGTGSGG